MGNHTDLKNEPLLLKGGFLNRLLQKLKTSDVDLIILS